MKFRVRKAPAVLACLALAGVGFVPSSASADGGRKPLNGIKHIVVIYEENHSFDNLYGRWGDVDGQHVIGLDDANAANTTQIDQGGAPYSCLLMTDVNLMSPPLSPDPTMAQTRRPAIPPVRMRSSRAIAVAKP